ncbi:hypothetical protein K439DRAFT_915701 [Ramaria rubella]|nr:hypothetical protein K439DRAFT_915701 [Ramaria rubella]
MPATNMWRDGGMKLYTKLLLSYAERRGESGPSRIVKDGSAHLEMSHESIMIERLSYRRNKLSCARTLDTSCRRRRCGRTWLYKNEGPVAVGSRCKAVQGGMFDSEKGKGQENRTGLGEHRGGRRVLTHVEWQRDSVRTPDHAWPSAGTCPSGVGREE